MFKNIKLPMIQKLTPIMLAQQIIGVQTMPSAIGNIFLVKKPPPDPNIVKFHKKYRFSRAKWYDASYNPLHYNEVVDWCTERFGKRDRHLDAWSRWGELNGNSVTVMRFRDEKDYVMFVLRWGK